jgi:hypothetical protein
MKMLAAVALLVVALPACAQRGGSRGGSSGHAASSFHAAYSAPHFTVAPHYASSYRPIAAPPRTGGGSELRFRRPYRTVYAAPAYYGSGWIAPGLLSYDAGLGYEEGYGDAGYGGYPADASPQPYPNEAAPYYGAETSPDQGSYPVNPYAAAPPPYVPAPAPQSAPAAAEAITLVYKDGRPAEQVHNYAATRTTLFVFDQHRREIPLSDLDLAATLKQNHDAGVDFQLPGAWNGTNAAH